MCECQHVGLAGGRGTRPRVAAALTPPAVSVLPLPLPALSVPVAGSVAGRAPAVRGAPLLTPILLAVLLLLRLVSRFARFTISLLLLGLFRFPFLLYLFPCGGCKGLECARMMIRIVYRKRWSGTNSTWFFLLIFS